jgi:hypothetical protein
MADGCAANQILKKRKKLIKKQRRHLFSRWRMDVPKGTGWLESM